MDKERKEKADIDPALLEPIGLVTVNFAMLEESLSLCIWKLIGAEGRVGQIVTAQLSFRQLVDLFCSLYRFRVRDAKLLAEFERIRKSLHKAEERRNKIIHSQWSAADELGASRRFKAVARAKRGLQYQVEKTTATDVHSLADFLARLTYEIMELIANWLYPETKTSA